MRFSRISAVFAMLIVPTVQAQDFDFSWNQATVYQLVTDRFSNGDSSNDFSYGRGLDGEGTPYDVDSTGHFLGGDFEGLTSWIEDGYFEQLGVNVLLISAPYEQVHGWIGGGDGDFQQYAYDGSWPLDYTELDKSFGSAEDFTRLINTAHASGMRIVINVDLNHVGPATMHDMSSFNYGGLISGGWRSWQPESKLGWQSYQREFVTYTDSTEAWSRWWGPDWIRADLVGYTACGTSEMDSCVGSLPDLRSDVEVGGLPEFLRLKWGEEKTATESGELAAFFARTRLKRTAANHVVKWLSDLVREYGIDGFRVSQATNTEYAVIESLRREATLALRSWKALHSEIAPDEKDFWMAGAEDESLAATSGDSAYGFDSVLNYEYQRSGSKDAPTLFLEYVTALETATHNILSFISSDETALHDRSTLMEAGTRLLLTPGGVSIFYGDESARNGGASVSEASQQRRSPMNWATTDEALLEHWRKVGTFRSSHPSIARGGYDMVQEDPYSFYRGIRIGTKTDEVVVVMGANGRTRIKVAIVWPDDTLLRDAYTGNIAIVSFGEVTFEADASGLILLEEVQID